MEQTQLAPNCILKGTTVPELDIKSTTPLFQRNTKDWEFCLQNEVAVLLSSFGRGGRTGAPAAGLPCQTAALATVSRTWFPTAPGTGSRYGRLGPRPCEPRRVPRGIQRAPIIWSHSLLRLFVQSHRWTFRHNSSDFFQGGTGCHFYASTIHMWLLRCPGTHHFCKRNGRGKKKNLKKITMFESNL